MSEVIDFFKITSGSCKFKQITIFSCVNQVLLYFSVSFSYALLQFKCFLIYNKFTTQHCLSCIEAAHAITYMNELPIFAHNLWMCCPRQYTSYQ